MTPSSLLALLLAQPDDVAQRRILQEHADQLDGEVVGGLKREADHLLRADVQQSLDMAGLIHRLADQTGNPLHLATALLAEANAQAIGLGHQHEGLELYQQAVRIYREQGCPLEEARAQVGRVWSLAVLGRYDEALAAGAWASETLEKHEDRLTLARLTANLAAINSRLGEDARSLELLNKARELCLGLGEEGERLLPRIEHNRVIVLRNLGQFDESIAASQQARNRLQQTGQWIAAARAEQNLAVTYFILGRYNEALDLLDRAREAFLEDGRQRDAMLVELFISDCLLQLRRFPEVRNKCQQARSLFARLGTRFEMAQAMLDEGVACVGLGRYQEAYDVFREARQVFEDEGNRVWAAAADLEIAAAYYYQEQWQDSLTLAEACAQVFDHYRQPVEDARANLTAARAAAAMGRRDLSHRLVSQAMDIGRSKNLPSVVYQAHHLLGLLARDSGDTGAALEEFEQAILEVERLRNCLMVEFRADFLEDKQVVYEDAVDLCLGMDHPYQALEYAERAKSRALLEMLTCRLDVSLQARDPADSYLVDELIRLRSQRDRLYRRWQSSDDFKVRGWAGGADTAGQTAVMEIEKQITDLWHKLLIRNADYAREASLWGVRTEPIQPFLPNDTVLLEYFVVHGRFVVFAAHGHELSAVRLDCSLAQVQHLLQLLWLNLRSTTRAAAAGRTTALVANAQGILQQLYRHLLAPLEDLLEAFPQCVVVPHGPLHYLPFHALYDGQRYMLQSHQLSYLPGASFLRYCAEMQPARSGALAFGHSYQGQLPHAVEEAQAIAARLHGQAYVEQEATTARLRESAAGCRTLHLATHGDFRPDNPLFSGLALADGWLTTFDIFNLHLNASLVTLSACQTGRNVVGGGDELLGLMRAFIYAGATSLVLSLWPVEDRSAAHLMDRFYGNLANGSTKGQALRQAQLALIDGKGSPTAGKDYAHPYFWAPYFLVGSSGPL